MREKGESGISGGDSPDSLGTWLWILVLILLVAGGLRFWGLPERGIINHDAGNHVLVARTYGAFAIWFLKSIFGGAPGPLAEFLIKHGGTIQIVPKEGFDALVTLATVLLDFSDYTASAVSALTGTLTVLTVFFLARTLFNDRVGLAAAALLAISPYALNFSRMGVSHTAAAFFAYLGIYVFSQWATSKPENRKGWTLFLAGASVGYGFTCHGGIYFLPIYLGLLAVFLPRFGTGLLQRFKGVLVPLAVGMASPLVFWELLTRTVKIVAYSRPGWAEILSQTSMGGYRTYLERVFWTAPFEVINYVDRPGFLTRREPLEYLRLILQLEGPILMFFLIAGTSGLLYISIRRRSFEEGFAVSLFLIPLIIWSTHRYQVARNFVVAVPAIALVAGWCLVSGANWLRRKGLPGRPGYWISLAVILIALPGWGLRGRIISHRSPYPGAIAYMERHLGRKHVSSAATISKVYVGRDNAESTLGTIDRFRGLAERGFAYVLLDDFHRYRFREDPIVLLADKSTPIEKIPYSYEIELFDAVNREQARFVKDGDGTVKVYSLRDLLDKASESPDKR